MQTLLLLVAVMYNSDPIGNKGEKGDHNHMLITVKDCLPYLSHGFRNKYSNKISLDNMLYFQNKWYKF